MKAHLISQPQCKVEALCVLAKAVVLQLTAQADPLEGVWKQTARPVRVQNRAGLQASQVLLLYREHHFENHWP